MTGPLGSAPTARPAVVLLRAGAIPAGVVGGAVAVACTVSSPQAGLSALLGTVLAAAALAVGPALLGWRGDASPPAMMALALAGYGITVGLLALVYLALGEVSWLSGEHAGYGTAASAAAWLGGQVRATTRLRTLAFGTPPEVTSGPSGPGQNGSPASP